MSTTTSTSPLLEPAAAVAPRARVDVDVGHQAVVALRIRAVLAAIARRLANRTA